MSIYYKDSNKPVEPIVFPNGISQHDVVRQVVSALESHDIVEVESAPGTGKSHMAMMIMAHYADMGTSGTVVDGRHRGILIEPVNAIATQIRYDFTARFRLFHSGKEISIGTVFGKRNYVCAIDRSVTADRAKCVTARYKCQYYAPVMTEQDFYRIFGSEKPPHITYNCITGTCYKIARYGCEYYDAHMAYVGTHIIVTNPQKYRLHALAGVLPDHAITVIDEADVSLQAIEPIYTTSFSEINAITSKYRVRNLLDVVKETFRNGADTYDVIMSHIRFWNALYDTIISDIKNCMNGCKDEECIESCYSSKIDDLLMIREKLTLLDIINKNKHPVMSRSSNSFRGDITISIAPSTMREYFKSVFGIGKRKLVLMSATLPTDQEMRMYGMEDRQTIIAWRRLPGTVYVGFVAGLDRATRTVINSSEYKLDFIQALVATIKTALAWSPVLIHVVAWDIWLENEILLNELDKIGVGRDAIDRDGRKVLELRDGKRDVVITSFATRGIDLYDNLLRAVVIPKAPYMPYDDPRVMLYRQSFGEAEFREWYHTKMLHAVLQMIARGVRHQNDWVVVFTPDLRVIKAIKELEAKNYVKPVWYRAPKPTRNVPLDPSIVQCNDDGCVFVKGQLVEQLLSESASSEEDKQSA
jgi:hypothetical protein